MGIQSTISPADRYREKREAMGQKQVQVWMEGELTSKLDELVKTGVYRNRSEAIADALNKLIQHAN